MAKITKIEGIGAASAKKLSKAGVRTVEGLLEQGATPQGRKQLADSSGIDTGMILGWVNRADLFRVKGIGEEYADLLEVAGVDTVPELARRNPENLRQAMVEVNTQRKLVRQLPSSGMVARWVSQAKELPRAIKY